VINRQKKKLFYCVVTVYYAGVHLPRKKLTVDLEHRERKLKVGKRGETIEGMGGRARLTVTNYQIRRRRAKVRFVEA